MADGSKRSIGTDSARTQIGCAGDLNCNLAQVPACTGSGMMTPSAVSSDREELVALLQDFQLRAINTYAEEAAVRKYMRATNLPESHSLTKYLSDRKNWEGIKPALSAIDRLRDGGREASHAGLDYVQHQEIQQKKS